MRSVIKGVVVDHRIPKLVGHIMNEPLYNRDRIKYVYNWIKLKHITHPNYAFPVSMGVVISVYFFSGLLYRRYYTGSFFGKFGDSNKTLTRVNYWPGQFASNENPHNHFNSVDNCWTTDPLWGLDEMPKRPWEVLKDPSRASFKIKRDVNRTYMDSFK